MNEKLLKYQKPIRIIIVIAAITGFILNSLGSRTPFRQYAYFTIQSNILVATVYLILLIKKADSKFLQVIKTQATVAIILTGLVYNLMLRPYLDGIDYEPDTLSDLLVHTITPILVIIEYICFQKTNRTPWYFPLYNLIFPLVYWLFTLVYVVLGGNFNGEDYTSNYPYFFLNFAEFGIGYFLLVLAFILFISYLLFFVNAIFYKKRVSERRT